MLIVGLGNSAVDIAVDMAKRAKHVTISTRRSAWVMPKYLMGQPVDKWSTFISRRLGFPIRLTRRIMSQLIKLGVGDQERFGLRRPDHPMWKEHATLSQDLLPYWISVKPNIARLDGSHVEFEDGSRSRFDAIVYATGYKTTFAFLDANLFDPRADVSNLYRRIVSTRHPNLLFAGLVQPIGPTIPLAEIQGGGSRKCWQGSSDFPMSPHERWR